MSASLPASLTGVPETWRLLRIWRNSPLSPLSQVIKVATPQYQLKAVFLSGSDVQAADDDDDLARHVWQHYTTSGTDLTKARERLESLSAPRPPVTSATATKVETSKVDVPEEKKSKVLQMKQKPPLDLTGTLSKNSELAGSALTKMFGSKVMLNLLY